MFFAALALITATPATLPGALAAAQAGDTITLAAGDYPGTLALAKRTFVPPLTIVMDGARVHQITLSAVDGLVLSGGTVQGAPGDADPPKRGIGLSARWARHLSVLGLVVTGWPLGAVVNESSDVTIRRVWFRGLRSDGLDIANSQRVAVDKVTCSDFHPSATDHGDCVQLWSSAGLPQTTDVAIRGSQSVGHMQGFDAFNHTSTGQLGFARLTITGNLVRNDYGNAIAVYDATDSVVTGNDVASLPGTFNLNGAPMKANIVVLGGSAKACGNAMPDVTRAPAAVPCAP